ncbi:MAG: hypothetical protein HQK84_02720 [Nitrospinae bacterium]|nr:hypothetical protein [Nitrospinota bacterium]
MADNSEINNSILKNLRFKFESYRESRLLLYISDLNLRNQLLLLFTQLRAKHLKFLSSKEEIILEVLENSSARKDEQFSVGILSFHHHYPNIPSIITSTLQALKNNMGTKRYGIKFIALAKDKEHLGAQFGDTVEVRTASIRAAAKNGLRGVILGNLDEPATIKAFVKKVTETIEGDVMARMNPIERQVKNLINVAYSYLNKMFWSEEEKEENVRKAIEIFEEVLETSKDNYDAKLGKAIASSRSGDPYLISEGVSMYEEVMQVGVDLERVYEGHADCCYKMADMAVLEDDKKKWLQKGVKTLSALNEVHHEEVNSIRKVHPDYNDKETFFHLANRHAKVASTLMKIDKKNKEKAIQEHMQGIEYDKTVKANYGVIGLLQSEAKSQADHLKIAKLCSIARENVPGMEIDYLISEAEAYYSAGKHVEATRVFKSVNNYVTKDRLENWVKYKNGHVIVDEKEAKQIAMFISFLNHRAIHFRRIGNFPRSIDDLGVAIELDPEKTYYDIYFNLSKAIMDTVKQKQQYNDYGLKDGLTFILESLKIAKKQSLDTYFDLLDSLKKDIVFAPFLKDIYKILEDNSFPLKL